MAAGALLATGALVAAGVLTGAGAAGLFLWASIREESELAPGSHMSFRPTQRGVEGNGTPNLVTSVMLAATPSKTSSPAA